ncbi:MAG: biotin transporter BioY [Phototrophicaceae bacterium]
MLRTLPKTRDWSDSYRVASIIVFTLLTAISARITIPLEPVPITLQPFAVILSGLVLGARDGFLSQFLYLTMIALGLPVDARMLGSVALFGATAGYLFGFPFASLVAGYLAQLGGNNFIVRWGAGMVGIIVVYLIGTTWLAVYLQLSAQAAWSAGVAPFILLDLGKAFVAAGVAEGGRTFLNR